MTIKIGGLYKVQNNSRIVYVRPTNGPNEFIGINVGTALLVIADVNYTDNTDYKTFLCLIGDKLYNIPKKYIGENHV